MKHLLIVLIAFNIAIVVSNFFAEPSVTEHRAAIPPIGPEDITRSGGIRVATVPMRVELQVMDRKHFNDRSTRILESSCGSTTCGSVRGWSISGVEPCSVVIPEGWIIVADGKRGEASWENSDNADTLAHEILHCLRGEWHSEYNRMLSRR